MPSIVIVDYGIGNLYSVQRAIEFNGFNSEITSDEKKIMKATHVILPGVGAFALAMSELKKRGLNNILKEIANKGTHLLGVCLGMQMLLDQSEEFGITEGLGIIPGNVIAIPNKLKNGQKIKIPHIGWNNLLLTNDNPSWDNTVLKGIKHNDSFYFIHSYKSITKDKKNCIAQTEFGDSIIDVVIMKNNVVGCQFHPEKSGIKGLDILKNFLKR